MVSFRSCHLTIIILHLLVNKHHLYYNIVIGHLSLDGMYMMEVDRVLRPGGYWVLSGPPITGGIITKHGSALERNWRRNKGRLKRLQNSFAGKRSMRWVRLLFGGKEQIMIYAASKIQNLRYVNQEIQMMPGIVFIPFTHSPSKKLITCLLAEQK